MTIFRFALVATLIASSITSTLAVAPILPRGIPQNAVAGLINKRSLATSTTPTKVVARDLVEREVHLTNSERFARGLAPNAPASFHRKRVLDGPTRSLPGGPRIARRAGPSCLPLTTLTGTITVFNTVTAAQVGQLDNEAYYELTTDSGAVPLSVTLPSGDLAVLAQPFSLLANNNANAAGDPLQVVGPPQTYAGAQTFGDLSNAPTSPPTAPTYSLLVNTDNANPGTFDGADTPFTGANSGESQIWTLSCIAGNYVFALQQVNSDGTSFTNTFPFYDTDNLDFGFTGSFSSYQASFPNSFLVTFFFTPTPP